MQAVVDFICVGAQKAGTTAFYDLIKQHPKIQMSDKKEVHYFDIDENFQKGLSWYNSFFVGGESEILRGECTPDYMLYGYVPERIFETFGKEIKLIFLLRNPVERAFSQFNFHKMKGVEFREDFIQAIGEEKLNLTNNEYIHWYEPAYYIERGLYYNQIKRFLDLFPKENLLFLTYDELFKTEHEKTMSQVCSFLGLEPVKLENKAKSNQSYVPKKGMKGRILNGLRKNKWILNTVKKLIPKKIYFYFRSVFVSKLQKRPDKISREEQDRLLHKYYLEDIKRLEKAISKDLSFWYKTTG